MKIEAVVLFSSNDKRFFKPCISNLLEAGINVKVVTYSHMWGGSEEDQEVLADYTGANGINLCVVKPIEEPGVYVGVPTKKLNSENPYFL
jgi:hypothetical protein